MRELPKLLTQEHIENPSVWAMVPIKPDQALSRDNACMMNIYQRRVLMANWKRHKDPEAYAGLMQQLQRHTDILPAMAK